MVVVLGQGHFTSRRLLYCSVIITQQYYQDQREHFDRKLRWVVLLSVIVFMRNNPDTALIKPWVTLDA